MFVPNHAKMTVSHHNISPTVEAARLHRQCAQAEPAPMSRSGARTVARNGAAMPTFQLVPNTVSDYARRHGQSGRHGQHQKQVLTPRRWLRSGPRERV